MRKIVFIAVAMMMFAVTANAQIKFGLKGGLNLTNVSFSGDLTKNLDKENQTGFFVGPTLKFTLPIVGLGIDASALYNQTKSKIDDVTVKQEAISVPLNLRYSLPVIPVYLFAGPQFDFNIGDKDFSLSNAGATLSNYKLKDSNISVNVGAGLLISHIQLTVNYNIACGKTGDFNVSEAAQSAWDTAVGDAKANSWQVGLAYYF